MTNKNTNSGHNGKKRYHISIRGTLMMTEKKTLSICKPLTRKSNMRFSLMTLKNYPKFKVTTFLLLWNALIEPCSSQLDIGIKIMRYFYMQ